LGSGKTNSLFSKAKPDSTSVLQISNEISEMDKNLFCSKEPTMNVVNLHRTALATYKHILQVTNKAVYVYNADELIFSHEFRFDRPIKDCVVNEPFLFVHTDDQRLHLFAFADDSNGFQMNGIESDLASIQAFSVLKDESGQFDLFKLESYSRKATEPLVPPSASANLNGKKIKFEQIDEDELLYGTGVDDIEMNIEFNKNEINDDHRPSVTVADGNDPNLTRVTHWLFAVSHDNLFIFELADASDVIELDCETGSLPNQKEIRLCFVMKKLSLVPRLLANSLVEPTGPSVEQPAVSRSSSLASDSTYQQPSINEISVVALGEYLLSPARVIL
jgi:hypothetical protein